MATIVDPVENLILSHEMVRTGGLAAGRL